MKEIVDIKFLKLNENAVVPHQATEFAGGWDVVAAEIIKESRNYVRVKLGFALSFPSNYKLTLVPRSSITKTNWIISNSPGLGDSDYRHEYEIRFRAIPTGVDVDGLLMYDDFPYSIGQKIGQVYLEEVIPIRFQTVDDINKTDRLGGFGSTGLYNKIV